MNQIKISIANLPEQLIPTDGAGYPTVEGKAQIALLAFGEVGGISVYLDTKMAAGVAISGRKARKFYVVE